jgi:hypothetical protein
LLDLSVQRYGDKKGKYPANKNEGKSGPLQDARVAHDAQNRERKLSEHQWQDDEGNTEGVGFVPSD